MIELAKFEVMAFMVILGAILCLRLVRGQIQTKSILSETKGESASDSLIQLMVATVLGASLYLLAIIESPSDTLPEGPGFLLALVGASNLGYLATKIHARVNL